jgi:hypothetical protein
MLCLRFMTLSPSLGVEMLRLLVATDVDCRHYWRLPLVNYGAAMTGQRIPARNSVDSPAVPARPLSAAPVFAPGS